MPSREPKDATPRYQREIEKILQRSKLPEDDDEAPPQTIDELERSRGRRWNKWRGTFQPAWSRRVPALSSSWLFGGALIALLAGVLIHGFFIPLAALALALFVAGYLVSWWKPSSGRGSATGAPRGFEKRWRGEVIDDRPSRRVDSGKRRPSLLDRFRHR